MSNLPPIRNPNDRSTAIDAEVIDDHRFIPPQKPRKRSLLWPILGWGTAVLLLCTFVGGMIVLAVMRNMPEFAASSVLDEPALEWEPAEHLAEVRAALDGTWQVADDDPQYFAIRRLLARLERAYAHDDLEKLQELIDWPAHMQRYYAAYRFQPLTTLDRIQLTQLEREEIGMPTQASDFRIAAVQELTPDNLLIYTYAQEGELSNTPYLFQFRRTDDEWKLVDWCEIPEMRWQAEQSGLGASPAFGDFAGDEQRRFVDDLNEADMLDYDQNEQAKEILRRAEDRRVISQWRDANRYLLGTRWQTLAENDEALRLYELADNADQYPWLHYLAASCYYEDGDYESSLAKCEEYEQAAGYHFDIMLIRGNCLQQLDRKSEAGEVALAMLRHRPADDEAMTLGLECLPAERYAELLSLIEDAEIDSDGLADLASQGLYADDETRFLAIRDFLAARSPDHSQLVALDAELLHYRGEVEQAFAKYRELCDRYRDSDPVALRDTLDSLISLGLNFHTPREIYESVADKRLVLEVMTEEIDYDEAYIGMNVLAELLPLHRAAEPDDPRLSYYAALVARDQEDYAAAVLEFQRAIAAFASVVQENEEEEYFLENLHNQLLQARYEAGEALAAYREADDRDEAYRLLAVILENEEDWGALTELNQAHESEGTSLLKRYFQLRLAEHEAQQRSDTAAIDQLLADYRQLQRENEDTEEIYPYQLTSRIFHLETEGSSWLANLRQQEHPESTFDRLVARFRREHDQQSLDQLLNYFRSEFPESYALMSYELEDLWKGDEYQKYIERVGIWPPQWIHDSYYPGSQEREKLTICHLMLGNTTAAWQVASEPEPTPRLQLLVNMATGDAAAVRDLLLDEANGLYFSLRPEPDWLRVPGVQGFLASAGFRELRREVPLEVEAPGAPLRAIILYPRIHSWNAEAIQTLLDKTELSGIEVTALPQPPLASHSFRLASPEGEFLLTVGSAPLLPAGGMRDYVQDGEDRFLPAIGGHASWLSLESAGPLDSGKKMLFHQVLCAFVGDATLVWSGDSDSNERIILTDADKLAAMKAGRVLTEFNEDLVSTWFPFGNVSLEKLTAPYRSVPPAKLRDASRKEPSGRIRVDLRQGSVVEHLWLRVVKLEHDGWGSYTFVGEAESNSLLNPYVLAGDLVEVSDYELVEWQE